MAGRDYGYSPEYKAHLKRRCGWAVRKCLEPMREVAREHGYALGLHGSVARDIDIIAAPWKPEAADSQTLIDALHRKLEDLTGWAVFSPSDPNPTAMAHGRLAWSIHLSRGVYFDISVMPRAA